MYETYLHRSLNSLFRPIAENGFWDSANQRITERLHHTKDWKWWHKPSDEMRYLVFCLSKILLAKELFQLNTSHYDDKIIASINYINNNKSKLSVSDLTYGALTTIYLQNKYYDIKSINWDEWGDLFHKAIDESLKRKDNHDSLILIAGKYALKKNNDPILKNKLIRLTENYLNSQNKTGFYETGDLRANYHQRNMYVLWGLISAVDFYPEKSNEIRKSAKKNLDWIWNSRREKIDDAFLWHPPLYLIRNNFGLKLPILNITHSKYLFDCHQTFFCNAINLYQIQFLTSEYEEEKKRSFDWIITHNRIGKNLVDITGIDQPIRIMHTNGELYIKNQNFKGIYEVGSYILALSSFAQKR